MAQASSSQVQVGFVPEVAYGVTPALPALQLIDYVSFTGNMNPTALSDPSIRADRQTAYSRRGNSSTEGDLEVVMAPGNYDAFLEAALMGTWTANELLVGKLARSFAIEQGFTDLALYRVFNGIQVNTLAMSITTEELVTATFGLIGSTTTDLLGTSIDATPVAVPAVDKFFHEGGSFNEGGAPVAYFSQIDFEINNGITGNYALGSLGYRNLTAGKVSVTGTVTGLFETAALYNKFRNDTETSLSFTLIAGATSLQFNFPRVKYTTGGITAAGDAGVTVELGFEALYDETLGNTLRVVRV